MAPVNISQNDYLALSLCVLCITILRRRIRHRTRVGKRRTRYWFSYLYVNILKACCHYLSFLWPSFLGQSFWRIFDSDNSQRKLWLKTFKDFDGIESHPIFLETWMGDVTKHVGTAKHKGNAKDVQSFRSLAMFLLGSSKSSIFYFSIYYLFLTLSTTPLTLTLSYAW
jgi:hypothetical protein